MNNVTESACSPQQLTNKSTAIDDTYALFTSVIIHRGLLICGKGTSFIQFAFLIFQKNHGANELNLRSLGKMVYVEGSTLMQMFLDLQFGLGSIFYT